MGSMLVLVNDIIVELDSPEAHASLFWHRVLEDDPRSMLTSGILDVVRDIFISTYADQAGTPADVNFIRDIAAVIVTYTGANVALFPTSHENGSMRITNVPEAVLQTLQKRSANGRTLNIDKFWKKAA